MREHHTTGQTIRGDWLEDHLVDVDLVALHGLLGALLATSAGLLSNCLLGRCGFLLCLGCHGCRKVQVCEASEQLRTRKVGRLETK